MTLTYEQKEKLLPVTTDRAYLRTILSQHAKAKVKMETDEKAYYDEETDRQATRHYYREIDFSDLSAITKLLRETHTNQVRYDPSEYVYPWVDLRPDGNLASIYSGKERRAETVIHEDYETSLKRKEAIEKISELDKDKIVQIERDFKYNCEHSVPQSWFNEQEPMRGDLHHLFTCEPVCNSIRSNYPYHDFAEYNPEAGANRIEAACGKADEELFEPEYGKGTVARAMLYFLVRYPGKIESSDESGIDTALLLDWHQAFPPEIYEKHRNQAIFDVQGNRNPFIDFPERMGDLWR